MQQQLHTGLLQFYCFFKSSPNFWGKKIHRQHWRRRWRRELTFQKLKTLVKTKKSYNWRYRKLSNDQSIFFANVSRWPFFNFSSQISKSKKFFSICSHSLSHSNFARFFVLPNVPAKANILTSEDQEAVVNIQRLGHFFSQPSGRQILNFNIHLMNLTEPEEGEKWILNGKFKPPRIPPNYVNVYTLTPFQEMFLTKHEIFPFFFYFKFKL